MFEQVLAGSVRRSLARRIRLANHLVDGINQQLATVRTVAGGVSVRLRWEVDPDQLDAVKAARALLLRDPGDLSEDETASLQAFVRARARPGPSRARSERTMGGPAARDARLPVLAPLHAAARAPGLGRSAAGHAASLTAAVHRRAIHRSSPPDAGVDRRPLHRRGGSAGGLSAAHPARSASSPVSTLPTGPSCSGRSRAGPRRHLHQRPRVVPVRNVRRHRHPPSPSADGRRAGDVDSIHMGWSTALDRPDGGMTNDGAYALPCPPRATAARRRAGPALWRRARPADRGDTTAADAGTAKRAGRPHGLAAPAACNNEDPRRAVVCDR